MDIYILGEGHAAIFITNDEKSTIINGRYDGVDSLVRDVIYKADSKFPRGKLNIKSLELRNGLTLLVSSDEERMPETFFYFGDAESLMDAAGVMQGMEYEIYRYNGGYVAAVREDSGDRLADFAYRLQHSPGWLWHLREHGSLISRSTDNRIV